MTVLLLIGRFAYGVKLPTHTLPGVAVTAIVGSVAFCCLGYALSTAINSEEAAQPMVQAIMLPLYFISGIFIPNINLPAWLRDVAKVFPVQHLSSGLHQAFDPDDDRKRNRLERRRRPRALGSRRARDRAAPVLVDACGYGDLKGDLWQLSPKREPGRARRTARCKRNGSCRS